MQFEQTWRAGRHDPQGNEKYPRFPAEVPGNVQYDYARSIGLDLYYADHVTQMQETEGYYWIYETALQFSAEAEEQVWFVAKGIDYIFDILLNGALLHSHEGMYTPVELNLTGKAEPGDLLQVVIHPHPRRALEPDEPNRSAADISCKPPVTYGWDWNPRLPISGIWLPCYIETRKADFIRSAEPFYTLNEARTEAEVWFETDCSAPVTYTLRDPGGKQIYRGREPRFRVKDVQLWWCNGQGAPALYEWEAATQSDCKRGVIGFRTLRLIQNAGTRMEPADFPKSRYPAWVTVELNGRAIFAKGSNWVNPELFFGRVTEARYEELITAAAEAHMNIFRVWGGAGLNKPAFYDLCDRRGMLVWQEFPLACNNYTGTPHYLNILEQEARAIIPQLRSHPSLLLWCGGNELFNGWSGMNDQSLALRLLNKLCYELDRQRPFLMTSPLTGMGHGSYFFASSKGTVFEMFGQARNTAYSEFGVSSLAPAEQLQKIIPPEELFPIESTPAWIAHHAFDAAGPDGWFCKKTIEQFWGASDTLEETVEKSQRLQADGYQFIFEEARRQWPHCSMAINWCWNEPWICAANNSLLTYPAVKKPAYFAVKEALRPVLASAKAPHYEWRSDAVFEAELWLLNDSTEAVEETVTACLELGEERFELIRWQTGAVPPGSGKLGPTVHFPLREIDTDTLRLVLETEDPAHRSVYRYRYRYKKRSGLKRQMNV